MLANYPVHMQIKRVLMTPADDPLMG
jgi:hypothetical protein